MKKTLLAAFVAASMNTATAVDTLNDTGQVLLFPYYTVQDNQETLIEVVNTTGDTKAIKVRFLEAYNSREVLDFNLYLSPEDVWTAKVMKGEDGKVKLITYDKSCTVPNDISGVEFRPYAYDGSLPQHPDDGGPKDVSRQYEGHIEIIEMGIANMKTLGGWDGDGDGEPDSTHVKGIPQNCKTLQNNWVDGTWRDQKADTLPPTGGLYGNAAVIDVAEGYSFEIPATVLDNFSDTNLHFSPGDLNPNLSHVSPPVSRVRKPDGTILTETWVRPIDAVSAVLMKKDVMGSYSSNKAVLGETSWVVTFPTKSHYVDYPSTDLGPFSEPFKGASCDRVNFVVYDREEDRHIPGVDYSPMPPTVQKRLCYETNVLNFDDSDALSARNTKMQVITDYRNGWNVLRFNGILGNHEGLPAIGFRMKKVGNPFVGVGASYARSHALRSRISSGTTSAN